MIRHLASVSSIALSGLLGAWSTVGQQGSPIPPREQQIAAAVLPLPTELRADATVLGYGPNGKLTTLRQGAGAMTCLASNPQLKDFHVACYHNSMEPFMARGRELRQQGVKDDQVDTVRFREVKAGKIKMPTTASLYQLFGGTFDPNSGTVTGAAALFVVYIPFATPATSGLSARPVKDAPWIMFPGTPKAHIMFTPKM